MIYCEKKKTLENPTTNLKLDVKDKQKPATASHVRKRYFFPGLTSQATNSC